MKKLIISFLKGLGFALNSNLEEQKTKLSKFEEKLISVEQMLTPEKVKQIKDPNLYEFKEKDLKIRINQTTGIKNSNSNSDKDWYEFNISKPCWGDGPAYSWDNSFYPFLKLGIFDIKEGKKIGYDDSKKDNYVEAPKLIKFLNTIKNTQMISGIINTTAFSFKLQKSAALSWDEVLPKVLEAITSLFPDVEKIQEEKTENQSAQS